MTDKRIKEPCPFCGTPAKEIIIDDTSCANLKRIYCPKCNVQFGWSTSKQELINKWNCRFR